MDKSMPEINEKTHLNVDWDPVCSNGRKVVGIEFNFDRYKDNSPEKTRLIELIIKEFGVSDQEVKKHSKDKTEEELASYVKYMQGVLKKKNNISNIASYARTTLINFVPPKKDSETPRSFYELLPEAQKDALKNDYVAAQNIPENLKSIVMQGLNESNDDFLKFVMQTREEVSAKAKKRETERKTNEYWNRAKDILQKKLASDYETWIQPVDFWNEDESTFQLVCESGDRYLAKYLETHYLADIQAALLEVGVEKEVSFHFQ